MATVPARKKAGTKRCFLSTAALAVLLTVATYRLMRAVDVAWRLSRPTSLTYYRRLLASLSCGENAHERFLHRYPLPSRTKGTKAWVYALSAEGGHVLAKEGLSLPPYKLRQLSYGHLWHSLHLTSVVCAAHYWCRTNPEYTLSREMLSYELVRNPPTVTLQAEEHTTTFTVVPDAFLCFERDGKKFPVLLEIDRGTEYQNKFKENLRYRINLIRSGVYARYFQLPGVVVAYATTGELPSRETRRAAMQQWALEIVDEMIAEEHRQGWYEIFRFCSLSDSIYEHTNALFGDGDAIWYCPGSDTAVPLFTPSHEQEEVDGNSTTTPYY